MKNRKWLAAIGPALIIMIVLGYVVGSRAIPGSVLDNLSGRATPPSLGDGLPVNDEVDEPLPQTAAADAVSNAASVPAPGWGAEDAIQAVPSPAPREASSSAKGDAAAPDDAEDDEDADRQGQADVARAIHRATLRALDRGEPVHWHKDGLEGYVTVSEPRETPTGLCRNVSATMGTDEDERQSGDHLWCQSDGSGEWVPLGR
jgi:hypothetical protein